MITVYYIIYYIKKSTHFLARKASETKIVYRYNQSTFM